MTDIELIEYIEDKPGIIKSDWYFHGTDRDLNTIEKILIEGIKCAYLRGEKSNQGYNGKYYVSVSKKSNDSNSVFKLFEHLPIFILEDIKPIKASKNNFIFGSFTETILPFRTSSKVDEYQSFLQIGPEKIVAMAFSLAHLLEDGYKFDKYHLLYLKKIILILKKLERDIPIYDLTSNREINQERVLALEFSE